MKSCLGLLAAWALTVAILHANVMTQVSVDSADRSRQIDAAFAAVDRRDSPGCALAAVQDGKIVYEHGYGMANLDYQIPITPTSIFYIASDSKQFTAFSVALLAEEGKLSLSDAIVKYIPELPHEVYGRVTVANLVYHSSGVRDYWGLRELSGQTPDAPFSQKDFLALMARQTELNFTPGEKFLYSNSGYALLAILVKRASGSNLPEFAEANIFSPLGMTHTSYGADHLTGLPGRATGYSFWDNVYRIDPASTEPLGDGGVRTTVEDLYLWDQNFYHNKLGGGTSSLIQLVETPGTLNSGEKLTYAFGLTWDEYKGLRFIGHAGSSFGYRADVMRFPEQKFSVICLCNTEAAQAAPWALDKKVVDLYLGNFLKPQPPTSTPLASRGAKAENKEAPIRMNVQELSRYTGGYEDKNGTLWILSVKDGKLMAAVQGLTFGFEPLSTTHLRGVGAPIPVDLYFSSAEPSSSRKVELEAAGQPKVTLESLALVNPTASELAAYAGDYVSSEVDAESKVYVADNKLLLNRNHFAAEPLEPLTRDEFKQGQHKVRFQRDSAGRVSSFRLDSQGVSGVLFTREK